MTWTTRRFTPKGQKPRYRFYYEGAATQLELMNIGNGHETWVFVYKGSPIKSAMGKMMFAKSVAEAKAGLEHAFFNWLHLKGTTWPSHTQSRQTRTATSPN